MRLHVASAPRNAVVSGHLKTWSALESICPTIQLSMATAGLAGLAVGAAEAGMGGGIWIVPMPLAADQTRPTKPLRKPRVSVPVL